MRALPMILAVLMLASPAAGQSRTESSSGQAAVEGKVRGERQSLRAQQNVLTQPELREGENRLDSIRRRAQTNPGAANDMMKIWEADRSLSTVNRPIPGGPANLSPVGPSLVGPGDRH